MAEPLDLRTLVEGVPIKIDGRPYLVKHPDALSLLEIKRFEALAPRAGALLQQPTLTASEGEELTALLQQICQVILSAPAAVQAKLTDSHRVLVLGTFTTLRSHLRAAIGALSLPVSPDRPRSTRKTSAKPSRG